MFQRFYFVKGCHLLRPFLPVILDSSFTWWVGTAFPCEVLCQCFQVLNGTDVVLDDCYLPETRNIACKCWVANVRRVMSHFVLWPWSAAISRFSLAMGDATAQMPEPRDRGGAGTAGAGSGSPPGGGGGVGQPCRCQRARFPHMELNHPVWQQ